jgi:hypothetical protein
MQKKDLLTKIGEVYGAPIDAAGKLYAGFRIADEGEDISGNILHV